MNESQALAFMPLMFALEASIPTCPLAFLMTSTNGLPSSAIALTRLKNYSQTTEFGRDELKVSESYLRLMLSITPSQVSCSEDQACPGM